MSGGLKAVGILAAPFTGGASLALTAAGSYTEYRAQKKAAKGVKQAAGINAALQQAQADQEELEAREAIRRMREEGQRFMGTQRSTIAASGAITSEGSPLDIIGETAGRIELEAAEANRVARQRRAFGYASAEETRRTGQLKAAGLRAAATGTALSGVAGLANSAMALGDAGVPGFKWAAPKKIGT